MAETYQNGSVSFIGQNVECIPPWLSTKYGKTAIRIDFSYNRIRSVKGLVGFENVKELVLDNNNLSDDVEFPKLATIETLTINKNNITKIDTFLNKIKESLPNLTYLSMLGNEACPNQLTSMENNDDDYQRYRYYVLYMLPKLNFLDSTPVTEKERKEAQRVGQYTKVVSSDFKNDQSVEEKRSRSATKDEGYTPLPSSSAQDGNDDDRKSTFGRCRFVYYGKHSEGNRFILNNDL